MGRCLSKHARGAELRGGGDIGGTASRCVVLKVAVSEGTQSRGKAASFAESNLARIFLNCGINFTGSPSMLLGCSVLMLPVRGNL